jgi:hypothetical protein
MSKKNVPDTNPPQPKRGRVSAETQPAEATHLVGTQTYSLRETAVLFGVGYTAFWEAMTRGDLSVTPIRIGGQWRFPKAPVHRVLGIEGE